MQNRFGEPIGERFDIEDWDDAADNIMDAAKEPWTIAAERLVGENGQIGRDIDALMPHELTDDRQAAA